MKKGRPKSSGRSAVLYVRITPAAKARLEELAKLTGKTLAQWLEAQ